MTPHVLAVAESDVGSVLVAILVAFVAAKVGGEVMERLGQPAVVGEISAGIVVGPSVLGLVPIEGTDGAVMLLLAELGVLVLLFQVGLETEPSELRAVGSQAAAVGILGVVLPFAGGFGVALLAGNDGIESAFVATVLVATSVGITARVMGDLGVITRRSSRIILGAALIDDVLGLLVLAVVSGLSEGGLTVASVVVLLVEAVGFIGVLMLFGPRLMGRLSHVIEWPRLPRAPFAIAVAILLGLSVAAEQLGLALIVGAFLAGSIFSATREHHRLESQFEPVADLLTPFFFVVTGAQVDVGSFADPSVLLFAGLLTVVAVAGKLGGGVLGARGLDRLDRTIVGVGMVPRGEVGIIVAGLGLSKGIVDLDLFGAALLMVIATTLVAPPALKVLHARAR